LKSKFIVFLIVLAIAGGAWWYYSSKSAATSVAEKFRELKPETKDISVVVSTTGVVQPQKRIEIKPPLNGRMEKILVNEGQMVRAGQILAWISSAERAALLDSALAKGKESVAYWEEVYKPIPLVSPIAGEVIVRAVEPGQSILSSTAVLTISDRLIIKAQVDETDIGKVKLGQTAEISLDAYPEIKVKATVDRIDFESTVISNVTLYQVDLKPRYIPEVFRSGMSATVKIIQESRSNVLQIPQEAVKQREGKSFVLVKNEEGKPRPRTIETGLNDGQNVEVISGLTEEDIVVIRTSNGTNGNSNRRSTGSNPFMPMRGGRGGGPGH
jgi:macrolide-specific efflux system membrane fusion protein